MVKLETAHKEFIEQLKSENKSESTLIAYKKDIEQLTKYLANKGLILISEVSTNHLEAFMKELADKEYTPKSISRKTNATKTFFKFLKNVGYITDNAADMLRHPKVDTKAPRILTKLEYRALRDAAKDDVRSYAMIETLLQTGITISEIAEMETEHLTLKKENGNLFVPAKNSKKTRNIPLNKAVVEAIKKYTKEERPDITSKYVYITKTGKPLLVRNIRSTINRYFRLAGVEKAKVNDLRHTFVAHHLEQGVGLLYISKIAGHKRVSTTERYLQYVKREKDQEKSELGII